MGRYVMAIDAGTTSIRTLIVDPEMSICASSSSFAPTYFPQPGWVEQEPEEIWSAVVSTMRRALFDAALSARDLVGLAVTNQRETVVVWERDTGTAVHRALVWQDGRTTGTCESLGREGASGWVQARSGLRLDPYFSASKIAWILDHVPGLRARAGRGEICAGTVDSWILWRLSGGRVHATDVTNASRTSLMDLTSLKWDDDLCELFEVPREVLANIEPSEHDFCETEHEVLGAPVLVAAMIGDQQAALLGQGCREVGQTKNT